MLDIITGWSRVKNCFNSPKVKGLRDKLNKNVHTVRFTMLVAYLAVTVITLVLMYTFSVGILDENLHSDERIDLYAKANITAQSISSSWDENDEGVMELRIDDIMERLLAGTNIRGVVTNNSYTVMYDNNREANMMGKVFMRNCIKRALDGQQADSTFEADNGETLAVSVPIEYGGEIVGSVYLAENLSSINDTLRAIRTSLVLFSILMVFVIGLISLGIGYVITRPIAQFTAVARAISKGDFSRRAEVKGSREIAEMGQALNFMCDELNALDEKRRNFVSDVSHELKTPMAGIKLLCDSLVKAESPDMDTIREFLNDMSEEVDRLTRLIDRLLELSRLDSNAELNLSQVDIAELCEGVVRSLTKLAFEKEITLDFDRDTDQTVIMVDYDKIYECVYNLCVNAIKYTPEDGRVTVRVKMTDSDCQVEVEDNGPGIPDGEKTKIFDRFYRLDDSRARDTGGTGLGLAITKEAVQLHNGSVDVTDREGGGSIFRLVLPRPESNK